MLEKTVLEAENINSQYLIRGGNFSDRFLVTMQTTRKRTKETPCHMHFIANRSFHLHRVCFAQRKN